MFIGEYRYNADAKGRVSVPAKFRDELGEKFVITKGLDQSLFVFPEAKWETFVSQLDTLPISNRDARAFTRFILSGASDVEMDKQGRMLIPQALREFANIEKELLVIGVGSRVEVWSQQAWDNYISQDNLDYDELAKQLEDLGI